MKVLLPWILLIYSGAGAAADVYLSCRFSDGLSSDVAIESSTGKWIFHEGTLRIVHGEKDAFGGEGSISQTSTTFKIQYTLGGLQITTTIWPESGQLIESTKRSGAESYRSAQCTPTPPKT